MEIVYEKGYAIDKKVDVVVNSANGYLMLGSSGAGRIREESPPLKLIGRMMYRRLLSKLAKQTQHFYSWNYRKHGYHPTIAQMSSLRLLSKVNGHKFKLGEAVLDREWSKNDRRSIIHAVSMTYKLQGNRHRRVHGTKTTIFKAATSVVNIVKDMIDYGDKVESIAIPVMAARATYGVKPKDSLDSILKALKGLKGSGVKKVIICFDNSESSAYLDTLKKKNQTV